jgi:hypothetical protein
MRVLGRRRLGSMRRRVRRRSGEQGGKRRGKRGGRGMCDFVGEKGKGDDEL